MQIRTIDIFLNLHNSPQAVCTRFAMPPYPSIISDFTTNTTLKTMILQHAVFQSGWNRG